MPYQNIVINADESELRRVLDEVCSEQGLEYSVEYDGDLIRVFYRRRGLFFKRVQMEVARVIPLKPSPNKLQVVFWLSDLEREKSYKFYSSIRVVLNRYMGDYPSIGRR